MVRRAGGSEDAAKKPIFAKGRKSSRLRVSRRRHALCPMPSRAATDKRSLFVPIRFDNQPRDVRKSVDLSVASISIPRARSNTYPQSRYVTSGGWPKDPQSWAHSAFLGGRTQTYGYLNEVSVCVKVRDGRNPRGFLHPARPSGCLTAIALFCPLGASFADKGLSISIYRIVPILATGKAGFLSSPNGISSFSASSDVFYTTSLPPRSDKQMTSTKTRFGFL